MTGMDGLYLPLPFHMYFHFLSLCAFPAPPPLRAPLLLFKIEHFGEHPAILLGSTVCVQLSEAQIVRKVEQDEKQLKEQEKKTGLKKGRREGWRFHNKQKELRSLCVRGRKNKQHVLLAFQSSLSTHALALYCEMQLIGIFDPFPTPYSQSAVFFYCLTAGAVRVRMCVRPVTLYAVVSGGVLVLNSNVD